MRMFHFWLKESRFWVQQCRVYKSSTGGPKLVFEPLCPRRFRNPECGPTLLSQYSADWDD